VVRDVRSENQARESLDVCRVQETSPRPEIPVIDPSAGQKRSPKAPTIEVAEPLFPTVMFLSRLAGVQNWCPN